jgi:predicted P-loop ATPase
LTWDRQPRLNSWLHRYLGVEQSPYAAVVGRMFMKAMVARVMQPGCKVDYMLILEGGQGEGKSTVCGILAAEWFSDGMPELHSDPVRVSQHLRGKWLIEISEMHAMSKAEAAGLKAFITRTDERFTPKYGRTEVLEPRQCVFAGTTNEAIYLRDSTGGRRFWPVTVGEINLKALRKDRDQLFAEAMHRYQAGESWWPSQKFEKTHMQSEQEARLEEDLWEEPIRRFLKHREGNTPTLYDIVRDALPLETANLRGHEGKRLSAIMRKLGWESYRTKTQRLWRKIPSGDSSR